MNKHMLFVLLTALCLGCQSTNLLESPLKPVDLRCEYRINPSVVDQPQARLGWVNLAPENQRGQVQTAWQIRVASDIDQLEQPDLWDSRKVISDQSQRIVYSGKQLESRQECWWQVRVWDRDDQVSAWSEPARWRMGLLDPSDWQAEWIGAPWQDEAALPKPQGGPNGIPAEMPPPAPFLRKSFSLEKEVERAVAYVTGLGFFELYLNGSKVGTDELVPNLTNYGKRPELLQENIPLPDNFREYRVLYLAYDVKDQLQQGENVIGAILGNGFYNPAKYWAGGYGSPRFLGQLHVTFTDGTETVIKSDQSWQVAQGPILTDMVYYGEHYDARKELNGWSTPDYDAGDWQTAALRNPPFGKLTAHTAETDRVTRQYAPTSIEQLDNGNYLVKFPEEVSGRLRFQNVEAAAGHKVEIKHISNIYSGDNTYIFKGGGPESYASRFNWFVFHSVELVNWPGEPQPDQLIAEAVNTDTKESARFETSNPLFNQINHIWKRSQMDNMHGGIASDCPHRERAPYTGDGQVACVTVMHNFDSRAFYHKWIQDIIGAQVVETGYVPNGAPWFPGCGGGVGWGAAICIMPWEFYLHYGSLDILEDSYEAMKAYVGYMQNWVDDRGIMHQQRKGHTDEPLRWFNLGEWAAPGPTVPNELVHTFFLWRCADLTAQSATALGRTQEASIYSKLAEKTKTAFHQVFYDAKAGSYGNAGGNILALRMGVPSENYAKVIAALKANIEANGGHLDTGIFGTQFFFEVLAENGMQDLAYSALNQRDFPSYGHWIELGSTTTREHWAEQGSYNHPMFGGGLTWFYRKLAGMQADPEQPGYRHIIFRPQPVAGLGFVAYFNQTPYGEAGIRWEQKDGQFSMEVKVPVGSIATIYVPAAEGEVVLESGKKAAEDPTVEFVGYQDGYAIYKIPSGTYTFQT